MSGRELVSGSYEGLPRKYRKALESTKESIAYLKGNLRQEELAFDVDGFTLETALKKTEDLLSRSQLFDEDSLKTIAKVALVWSMLYVTIQRNRQLGVTVYQELQRSGSPIGREAMEMRVSRESHQQLEICLGALRKALANDS